eukprot:COSAG01_NODE_5920_length_3955_cov_7.103502_4_plen_135_part_00
MRAGRATCISNIQQDMIEQTLAILASMMQQAAHDATLYCAEAKRTVIMPRDIELALKRLVLPGSAYWTRDDLSEEAAVTETPEQLAERQRQMQEALARQLVVYILTVPSPSPPLPPTPPPIHVAHLLPLSARPP